MKKDKFIISVMLSAAFLAIFLTIPMLPEVKGWGETTPYHNWPYDCCVRCEHTGTFNASDDTFTATSIEGWYDQDTPTPPAYISGNWSFTRGYGGGGPDHDYTTDSYMICGYVYGSYGFTHYDYNTPSYGYGPYGDVPAYYQYWVKYL